MIGLGFSSLLLLYAGALFLAVLSLWLAGEWQSARRRRREWRALGQCRLCAAWIRPPADVWRCPACQALNERTLPADL